MVQLASVGIVGVFCVIGATLFTLLVKSQIGLRVSEKEESTGLDISEHGTKFYFSSKFRYSFCNFQIKRRSNDLFLIIISFIFSIIIY
ncbi:MAG: hypothetical protein CM15mP102_03710 [Flavobacteriales bacterium]|nr:MAG: hypothetical protein CM15mP102_03710 [Flavobacteriales bacterium]